MTSDLKETTVSPELEEPSHSKDENLEGHPITLPDGQSINSSDLPEKDVQAGIQQVEAITAVWSKRSLVLAYVLIFIILFINSLQEQVANQLVPYVYSNFALHSLVPVTTILSSIIGALVKLPVAKILDIWGRPQGFGCMVGCCTLGLIMMAACNNVETYCAAQVFYWVGYDGMLYVLNVFVADTSRLKNRALMFAFTTSPYIVTAWIGGPAASSFLYGAGWRWAYGTFAIVVPVVTAPLIILFAYNYRKADRAGLIPERQSNRNFLQSVQYYAIEFDLIGILLLAGGLAFFLLPFSLYTYQPLGWRSALVISMIIIGGLLLILFAVYEKLWAPKTFIPFALLTDRTVIGACLLAGTFFVSFYCWDSYFTSYLQVVQGLSITEAAYVANIYTVGSSLWGLVVGVLIRWSGRFKWLALYFGLPLQILGVGLMIYFRQPGWGIGLLCMCQIFIAFSGGTMVICWQMAVMAASKHEHIAVVLAIESMFNSIGAAIGSTISAAIWTTTFPAALALYLPQSEQSNLFEIYETLTVQLSYPEGSPARNAINMAYGDGQRWLCTAGTAVLVVGVVATAIWKDYRVKDFKQVKGTVV